MKVEGEEAKRRYGYNQREKGAEIAKRAEQRACVAMASISIVQYNVAVSSCNKIIHRHV